MKILNKLFIFGCILVLLVNIVTPTQLYAADLEDGCRLNEPAGNVMNRSIAGRITAYYSGKDIDYSTGKLKTYDSTYKGPTSYASITAQTFKCSIKDLPATTKNQYREIMVTYYSNSYELLHTVAYVNLEEFKIGLDDVQIDIDNGRLVISGTMYNDKDAWNQIFSSVSGVIVGVTGIGVLCCFLAMVLQIIKLGASAGNPMEREKAVKGILWTGIGITGCSAAALIFGLAYNII